MRYCPNVSARRVWKASPLASRRDDTGGWATSGSASPGWKLIETGRLYDLPPTTE